MRYVTHKQFVDFYRNGDLTISVDKNKAGNFVLSKFSKTQYRLAHNFWIWLGIILTVPGAIVLIFINWLYAIGSFFLGMIVLSASRKSAAQFVVEQMIESEDFWMYTLLHNGAKISDLTGEIVSFSDSKDQ